MYINWFIFRLSLNHPVNSSPFAFNNRRSTPNIISPFHTQSPLAAIRFYIKSSFLRYVRIRFIYIVCLIFSHYNSPVWNSPSNTSKKSLRPNVTITNSVNYNSPLSISRIANARLGHGNMYEDNNSKPVSPDICLEYMWTESIKGYLF